MRDNLINYFIYVALIAATSMCLGCIDTDTITDVLTSNPQEKIFEPLPPGEGLSIGEVAPPFSLPDADGNLVSLSDYAGQKIVIQFYATGT